MVHDPRVSNLMSRLGGLYRDPSRVDKDASSVLKSSVGLHLKPAIAPLVENTGDTSNCLVLQGTIAMVFRGTTYQLLVDIYLPAGYPSRPPICFVRLGAPNMYLKENHRHVGSDGMVYLPYLHEWRPHTHNLIELVVAMSSVFSADPPVFTRAATAADTPPPPPPSTATSATANSERDIQSQVEKIVAREAEEANRAAEAARRAMQEEEEREQALKAQREWEAQKKRQVESEVTEKIQAHLKELSLQVKSNVQMDWRDQQGLVKSRDDTIKNQLENLQAQKHRLQEQIQVAESKTAEIQEWLQENPANGEETKTNQVPVDDLCRPTSKIYEQMLDLSAENAALTDALYFLDRAMYGGNLDCKTHLKNVRKLAKRQFLVRAHLLKIKGVLGI